ncbi:MAG: hypothetical protein Q8M76_13330, partial [Spirochaetaceae bacterium]|nr:hypothetical protein [Spirochaetaceae bacterium]
SDEVITGTGGASPAPTAPESNVVVPSPEPSAISAAAPASDVAVPSSGPFSVPAAAPASLGDVVRAFKSLSARAVGRPLWQRSFYDHVVRDEADLRRIRQYIVDNPIQWALDPENPVSSTP